MSVSRYYFAWRMIEAARAQDEHNKLRRTRAAIRREFDPVTDLSNKEFTNRYRLTKEAFEYLCEELREKSTLRSTQQVSLEEKVLVTLFFYASGSYQRPVGVAKNFSQKMCSVYINEVTDALIDKQMLDTYICFPTTPDARQIVSQSESGAMSLGLKFYIFYAKYGLPGILGCVDGCHFKIFTPPNKEEHLYYCRKHYHSLNVQMVCDSACRIISINAKFGGHNHDAFIWENSNVNEYMQSLHGQGVLCWLLGDSGYPQRPWLMTPFLDVTPGSPEAAYNQRQMTARVVIENTFGRLKNRWRCLSKDRVLHYKPEKCAKIIQACCVLHNIALDFKVPEPENSGLNCDETELPQPANEAFTETTSNDLIRGRLYRDRLVLRLRNQ